MLLSEELHKLIGTEKEITILGPGDAAIAKLRDFYRRVLYVKAERYQRLCQIKDCIEAFMRKQEEYKDCMVTFRFN